MMAKPVLLPGDAGEGVRHEAFLLLDRWPSFDLLHFYPIAGRTATGFSPSSQTSRASPTSR